ncbi:acyl-CoA dehydrogenase, partial [bacterium]|nr:acyl-CoA dehydrogenase [bacterium]
FSREIAMAKCFAAEAAVNAAMEGLQVLGGYGYTMEYDIQRYVRDSVALLSAGLSLDFLKERIGASLGLN